MEAIFIPGNTGETAWTIGLRAEKLHTKLQGSCIPRGSNLTLAGERNKRKSEREEEENQ
jgi:hypothetical protein